MDDETPTEDEFRSGDCVRFIRDQPQTIGDGAEAVNAMTWDEARNSPAWAAQTGDRVVAFGSARISVVGGPFKESNHE